MILFLHVLGACVWFGTAVTLPFWGNRMNRATHLQVVLDIMDTVYLLKCIFIMGGLVLTLATGVVLTNRLGFGIFQFVGEASWLGYSQWLAVVIAANSTVLLFLMTSGRLGRRSYFRYVPLIGYNNIALIALVLMEMSVKPSPSNQILLLFLPLGLLLAADTSFVLARRRANRRLRNMSATEFAEHYFGLLRDEKMTDFFRLFRDDAVFVDPFATGPVRGIKSIERFFQALGDQFDEITIDPVRVDGDGVRINIEWEAHGVTKNGAPMSGLKGTNRMERLRGKVASVNIDFDRTKLPPVQLVKV